MAQKNKSDWRMAMSLLGQLGYVIAVPLVILALTGRYIDKIYHTAPWFLIAGMFMALVISTFWVYKKTGEIMKNATENDKKPDNLTPKT